MFEMLVLDVVSKFTDVTEIKLIEPKHGRTCKLFMNSNVYCVDSCPGNINT